MTQTLTEPTAEQLKDLAYHHWQLRGQPVHDSHHDWYEAQRITSREPSRRFLRHGFSGKWILWDKWVQATLRRQYLAIEAEIDPNGLAAALELRLPGKATTVLIAVLDGAPEFSYHGDWSCPTYGVRPANRIEAKDAQFYRYASEVLRLHGAHSIEETAAKNRTGASEEGRTYQDGCVVAFADDQSLIQALAAALCLRDRLLKYNEEKSLPWPDRLHARVAIGPSCRSVVAFLPHAWCDEIVVDPDQLADLDRPQQQLCFAVGVKPGPASEPAGPSDDTQETMGYEQLSLYLG